ncbi:MAG: hypothetical protein U0670_20285 [Anaerolineae bacterium]
MGSNGWTQGYIGGKQSEWLPRSFKDVLRMCKEAVEYASAQNKSWIMLHQVQIRELIAYTNTFSQTVRGGAELLGWMIEYVLDLPSDQRDLWSAVYFDMITAILNEPEYQTLADLLQDHFRLLKRSGYRMPASSKKKQPSLNHSYISSLVNTEIRVFRDSLRSTSAQKPDTAWLRIMYYLVDLIDSSDRALLARAHVSIMLVHYLRQEFLHAIDHATIAAQLFQRMPSGESLKLSKERAETYLYRGVCYTSLDLYELAETDLNRATRYADSMDWHIDQLIAQARLWYDKYAFAKAYQLYTQALELLMLENVSHEGRWFRDQRMRIEMGMGMTLKWLKDYEEAHNRLNSSGRLSRELEDTFLTAFNEFQRALLYAHQWNRSEAKLRIAETYRLLRQVRPDSARSWLLKLARQVRKRLDEGQLGPGEYTTS